MAYGTIKVDTITFTDAGIDKSVTISGLVQNPTFTGNVTVTGTVSGATANFVSGVFTTQISGATVTGGNANFTSGTFTNISGGVYTITSGVFALGTSGTPSISFASDPNTGIYSPGADQVAISASGTQRVNFGTGEVVFNETGENYDFRIESDTNANIFFVDASANAVGIGTISPTLKLSVDGDTWFGNGSGVEIGRLFNDAGVLHLRASNNVTGLALGTAGGEKARIDSSGRLLVGTPTARDPAGEAKIEAFNGPIAVSTYADSAGFYGLNFIKSRGTSTNVIVQTDDSLAGVRFFGADGTGFPEAARIEAYVDGTLGQTAGTFAIGTEYRILTTGTTNFTLIGAANSTPGTVFTATGAGTGTGTAIRTAGDMPGRLVFSVTADGASSPTERMRIGNDGTSRMFASNYGFLIANGQSAGTTYTALEIYHSATSTISPGTLSLQVYNNGNVQNTNGSYGTLSDAKLKENIVDASSQWDDLKAIQIRNWNFKAKTGHETHRQIGPIAQELEQVCPGLVFETPDRDEDGNETGEVTKGVNQSVLYMKAVKALQEAMERIETLEAKVTVLEAQ